MFFAFPHLLQNKGVFWQDKVRKKKRRSEKFINSLEQIDIGIDKGKADCIS